MKAFLDTSSVIKLYHQEEGSDFVMEALSNDIEEVFLSGKSTGSGLHPVQPLDMPCQ